MLLSGLMPGGALLHVPGPGWLRSACFRDHRLEGVAARLPRLARPLTVGASSGNRLSCPDDAAFDSISSAMLSAPASPNSSLARSATGLSRTTPLSVLMMRFSHSSMWMPMGWAKRRATSKGSEPGRATGGSFLVVVVFLFLSVAAIGVGSLSSAL